MIDIIIDIDPIRSKFNTIYYILDDDECSQANKCDVNADCVNLPRTYRCECKDGFTGDGEMCTGSKSVTLVTVHTYKCVQVRKV